MCRCWQLFANTCHHKNTSTNRRCYCFNLTCYDFLNVECFYALMSRCDKEQFQSEGCLNYETFDLINVWYAPAIFKEVSRCILLPLCVGWHNWCLTCTYLLTELSWAQSPAQKSNNDKPKPFQTVFLMINVTFGVKPYHLHFSPTHSPG